MQSRVSLDSIVSRFSLVSLICALMLTVGVGNAWGAEDDTHDYSQSISTLLNNCAVPSDITISDPGFSVKQVIITYSYNKTYPVTANVTIGGDAWGSGYSMIQSSTSASISDDAASGDIVISFTANSSCSGTKKGTLSISNVCLVEGPSGGGGCTTGVVSSIKAGDVVLMYYSTYELSGIASNGDSHWGDKASCTSDAPSGLYPLTVEAGSSNGTWSFKNGDNYLAVTSDANMLNTSTTKNANSSWTVSISSGNATITNSAYSSRIIKFNTSGARFSTYSGTVSNTYLVKLYKYCGDVKYHVTYYGNGNTGGSVPTDNNAYASNQSATVIGNTGNLEKTGYTWAGWNTQADGNGTTYTAGNTISMSGGGIALYAKWNPTTCTVTYDGNGNTSGSVPTDGTAYNSGATVTVKSNTGNLARTGYTFGGWNTNAAGTGTNYAAGSGTFSITENTTLYAKWTAETYTVTWSVNGSTYQTTSNVSYNTTTSTPANPTPSGNCAGLVFRGWTATENYEHATDAPGDMFNSTTPAITRNITFYAVFAEEQ